ncbi:MAG TPA: tetratricopeptide repeat protein [Polyangiaceae bacterium]|nr:tetratricopeptide repeat protein [Polyangiaceae bacterium]
MRQVSTTPRRRPIGRLHRRWLALAVLICAGASAGAPRRAIADETSASNVEAARRHFEKARTDYAQGSYREAIAELEAAHSLDPSAKDLVFNLGVVHEKLSDIDDALQWFQLYTTMSLTPQERERADAYIRRLEGAKKEVPPKTGAPAASSGTSSPGLPPSPGNEPGEVATPPATHGRLDAATITATSVAGAAVIFGVVLAVKADQDRPSNGFVTGRDGTYAQFADRTAMAHREAIAADIGFGVSIAAGITAVVLYFARTRDVTGTTQGSPRSPSVSAAPLTGGGALIVQGSL